VEAETNSAPRVPEPKETPTDRPVSEVLSDCVDRGGAPRLHRAPSYRSEALVAEPITAPAASMDATHGLSAD